jgi:NAD(P)-dependent dehydrogenase (short-subunit alcohol dehydrogenase family)
MGRMESGDASGGARALRNTPLARVGNADEIAAVVDFVCGPDASYITGTDILVDGGTIASMRVHAPEKIRERWDNPWMIPTGG